MGASILDNLNTDQLWKLMPPHAHHKGEDYHFSAILGSRRKIVRYENDDGKSLFNTYRSDDTLSEALRGWLELLIEHDCLTTMQLEWLISKL